MPVPPARPTSSAPSTRGPESIRCGVPRLHRGTVHRLLGTQWEERPGTLGRARVGRELVIDDGSAGGLPGTIWCVAPEFARFSYFDDPGKTAAAWSASGAGAAFTVGDLGRLDAEGYLYLHGRRTDLIVTGGVNVYPAEVEAVLRECPGVDDVAVFGQPDDRWGERVCAAIVGSATPGDVDAFAHTALAGYRRPKQYVGVPELPHRQRQSAPRRIGGLGVRSRAQLSAATVSLTPMTVRKLPCSPPAAFAPCLSSAVGGLIERYTEIDPDIELIAYTDGYQGLLKGESITIDAEMRENAALLNRFGGSPIGNSRSS